MRRTLVAATLLLAVLGPAAAKLVTAARECPFPDQEQAETYRALAESAVARGVDDVGVSVVFWLICDNQSRHLNDAGLSEIQVFSAKHARPMRVLPFGLALVRLLVDP